MCRSSEGPVVVEREKEKKEGGQGKRSVGSLEKKEGKTSARWLRKILGGGGGEGQGVACRNCHSWISF